MRLFTHHPMTALSLGKELIDGRTRPFYIHRVPKGTKMPTSAHARREARQISILKKATQLFSKRGYAKTDLQEVADALTIGKGTIYRYFSNKECLFLAAVDHGMSELSACVDHVAENTADPLLKIREGIKAYLKYFEENPDMVELIIQERAYFKNRKKPTYFEYKEKNIKKWDALLESLIKTKQLRNIPAEKINNTVSDLLYGTIFVNHFANRHLSSELQAHDITDIIFNGILPRTEKGKKK